MVNSKINCILNSEALKSLPFLNYLLMKKLGLILLTISFLFFGIEFGFSQVRLYDTWIFGEHQVVSLNFKKDQTIIIERNASDLGMTAANSSISDSEGNLLFSSNGCRIYNKEFDIMLNGDSISNGGNLHLNWCNGLGSPFNQSVMILPRYNDPCRYHVIHHDVFFGLSMPYGNLYTSLVDMRYDNGLGKVMEKDNIIHTDSIAWFGLTGYMHANRRDWWIVLPKVESNCYIKLRLSEEGLSYHSTQCLGEMNVLTSDG